LDAEFDHLPASDLNGSPNEGVAAKDSSSSSARAKFHYAVEFVAKGPGAVDVLAIDRIPLPASSENTEVSV
jgi:hypothetical protein